MGYELWYFRQSETTTSVHNQVFAMKHFPIWLSASTLMTTKAPLPEMRSRLYPTGARVSYRPQCTTKSQSSGIMVPDEDSISGAISRYLIRRTERRATSYRPLPNANFIPINHNDVDHIQSQLLLHCEMPTMTYRRSDASEHSKQHPSHCVTTYIHSQVLTPTGHTSDKSKQLTSYG